MAEGDRLRRISRKQNRVRVLSGFQNPYPYMSDPEAMVKLQLERFGVPYSWRYFDAADQAPTVMSLIPDFAPEFTLREYRVVIIVLGGFFGTLPGALDKSALAAVALEYDGWRVLLLPEHEIRRDVRGIILKDIPELAVPAFRGIERPNPYGAKDLMAQRLIRLGGQGLKRTHFVRQDDSSNTRRNSDVDRRHHRRKRNRRKRGAPQRATELQ